MKFLVIGLGSMGKRRIRNLQHLGQSDIVAFEPRADRREEALVKYGVRGFAEWPAAREGGADAWIISTPPDTHLDYAFEATDRKIPFFTEANVTDLPSPERSRSSFAQAGERAAELIRRLDANRLIGCPSCTMRYYSGPRKIKEFVRSGAVGRPLVFTYQCGQYLPDWHPWESYKDFYVSKRATGACREIVPFELAWLTDIFGPVSRLACMKDKLSDLDADIDDVYQLLLRHDGLIGHLLVDVVARPAVRVFRLNGTEGTVEWDHGANTVRVWRAQIGRWDAIDLGARTVEAGYIHPEEPYVAEMADFIAAARGERAWPYSFRDDETVLDLLLRAERDAERRNA